MSDKHFVLKRDLPIDLTLVLKIDVLEHVSRSCPRVTTGREFDRRPKGARAGYGEGRAKLLGSRVEAVEIESFRTVWAANITDRNLREDFDVKHLFRVALLALGGLAVTPAIASAGACNYHVICRFHVVAADGGDRACVVYQAGDCSVNTMCAG